MQQIALNNSFKLILPFLNLDVDNVDKPYRNGQLDNFFMHYISRGRW